MTSDGPYHSAHLAPARVRDPLSGFASVGAYAGRLQAFAHDLTSSPSLPEAYADCDVLYAEPPWRRGFDEFNRRAGVANEDRSYRAFLQHLGRIIESATVPTYVLTGRHAMGSLPTPDLTIATTLYKWDAVALGYRPGAEVFGEYPTAPDLIDALAEHYGRVGDFCCGYGRTGRAFLRAGKAAVLSDLDPKCIGYIGEHAMEWLT